MTGPGPHSDPAYVTDMEDRAEERSRQRDGASCKCLDGESCVITGRHGALLDVAPVSAADKQKRCQLPDGWQLCRMERLRIARRLAA